jgi:hypothetical protein
MTMLHMEVSIAAQPFVSGAPVPARVTIRNDGQEPADLMALGVPGKLEFWLRDPGGRVLSTFQGDGSGQRFAALAPRAEVRIDVDVQKRLATPIAPGRYELAVALREQEQLVANASAALVVEPLVPEMVLRRADREAAWLGTLVAHRRRDGSRTIFYSFDDPRIPFAGMLQPLMDAPASPEPPTLALAPRALDTPAAVWAATLGGRGLVIGRASAAPGDAVPTAAFPPIPMQGKLLRGGAALPDGSFVVAALSARADAVAAVRMSADGTRGGMPLALGAAIPALAGAVAVTAVDGNNVDIALWWVEGGRAVQRLEIGTTSPEVKRTPNAFVATGRIGAIQAEPFDGISDSWIHVLDVAASGPPQATLVRLQGFGGRVVDRAALPALPAPVTGVSSWWLPSSGVAGAGPVLALSNAGPWLLRDGKWDRPAVAIDDYSNAELVRFGDGLWLSTWSPTIGLRRVLLGPAHVSNAAN